MTIFEQIYFRVKYLIEDIQLSRNQTQIGKNMCRKRVAITLPTGTFCRQKYDEDTTSKIVLKFNTVIT